MISLKKILLLSFVFFLTSCATDDIPKSFSAESSEMHIFAFDNKGVSFTGTAKFMKEVTNIFGNLETIVRGEISNDNESCTVKSEMGDDWGAHWELRCKKRDIDYKGVVPNEGIETGKGNLKGGKLSDSRLNYKTGDKYFKAIEELGGQDKLTWVYIRISQSHEVILDEINEFNKDKMTMIAAFDEESKYMYGSSGSPIKPCFVVDCVVVCLVVTWFFC